MAMEAEVEEKPPEADGDGGVSHVKVRLARVREELEPEKVARGGHGDAEVQRVVNVLHDIKKVLLRLRLLFGAGAVKGRVTRGTGRIGRDSVEHLGRHQGRELHRGGPHQPLVAHQQEQGDGGA